MLSNLIITVGTLHAESNKKIDVRRQSDCAVQTDVLDTSPSHPARVNLSDVQNHLNSLTSPYTKTSLRHLYKDLGKLEEKTQRRLLELRQSVSSWSSASGGYLMWNETLQLQVHAMGRHDRDAVENLLGVLLMRKVAGQELLCCLYDIEEDDMPCNAYEWRVKSRSRLHLISVVSLGLGITDVWMLILNRKLQQLNGVREDEALVIDQLLASDEEDW